MSWPTSPYNGQQTTINGITYQYDDAVGVWNRLSLATTILSTDSLTLANLTVTRLAQLGDIGNVHINGGTNGQVISTDGTGNLSWVTGSGGGGSSTLSGLTDVTISSAANNQILSYDSTSSKWKNKTPASVQAFVKSDITEITAGSSITITSDYANTSYPAGVFTISQLGPLTLSVTDIWASGASSKNAYSNYAAGTINTQNISITLSVGNATFDVHSSDTITIGSGTVTGANLTGLGITGTGGTYTIPSSYFSSTYQTQASVTVAVNLTTSRGAKTSSGTTLTNIQAIPFAVNALTGSFTSSTVPFWSLNQTFSWNASVTGTVASGNVAYSGGSSGSLTSSGATSGTSPSLDSTLSYTISSSDYRGAGLYGAGTRTIPSTVSGTISAATTYYPLFHKITSSSANPNFTTSDTYNPYAFSVGQGATTNSTPTDYLWIATPTSTAHTFVFDFLGAQVGIDPDVSYTSQTISGYTYNVYGFTNASTPTLIYTKT